MTLSPLQRLQVNDGMLITADHWQIAHSYHRQRQAIHYESLHLGGIVSGLGISIGPIPESAASRYRQPRWLTIQPGLAIDSFGNPIVVAQAESCYLSAQPTEAVTIYIVLKHSERTAQDGVNVVQEAFQILEKDSPPTVGEVELCRILLLPQAEAIAPPQDVFTPGANQLDLRYRQPLRSRPQRFATVSSWSGQERTKAQFHALLMSLPGLYPALGGQWVNDPAESNLGHIFYDDFCDLNRSQQQQLAQSLNRGSVVVVEAAVSSLSDLYKVEAELRSSVIADEGNALLAEKSSLQLSAEQELHKIRQCINDAVEDLAFPLRTFMQEQQLPSIPEKISEQKSLGVTHPLRSQPFLFSQFPTINGRPIGVYVWGGLVLIIGALPEAWGISEQYPLSREDMRSAQELGINLLHFASCRHQMQQYLAAA